MKREVGYCSPEVFKDRRISSKSDIWGMGVILHELCTLEHRFNHNKSYVQNGNYTEHYDSEKHPIPTTPYSKELTEIIDLMLLQDYCLRPAATEILAMTRNWLPSINMTALVDENFMELAEFTTAKY